MGEVSCDDFYDICEKEKITEYPVVRVYPKNPIPTVDFTKENYSIDSVKKTALRFIESKAIEITQTNVETFLKDQPGKPKVLFFSDKEKGEPILLKALSSSFDKTLFFGHVRKGEETLVKKYKVKEFPAMLIFKGGQKPVPFEGAFKYQEMYDFLNVYSEIFEFPGNQEPESAASKPWLSEPLPELRRESGNDICL